MYKTCFSLRTTFQNIVATFCMTYQSLAQRWQPEYRSIMAAVVLIVVIYISWGFMDPEKILGFSWKASRRIPNLPKCSVYVLFWQHRMKQNKIHMKSRPKNDAKLLWKKYSKPKTQSFSRNPKTTNPIPRTAPFMWTWLLATASDRPKRNSNSPEWPSIHGTIGIFTYHFTINNEPNL